MSLAERLGRIIGTVLVIAFIVGSAALTCIFIGYFVAVGVRYGWS